MAKRLSTEQFISRAEEVHGSKYDYSETKYVKSSEKVMITCLLHGTFNQLPHQHLIGKGCKPCGNIKKAMSKTKTIKQFIAEARKVHGDKYDYSNAVYINNSTPLRIICPIHGEFTQRPVDHIHQSSGCNKCALISTANTNRITIDTFIERSIEHHGNKYDYSKVTYAQLKDKVTIICPEHGEFEQSASLHSTGHGCSKCANRGFDKFKPGILYYVSLDVEGKRYYKVGITNRTVKERFKPETSVKVTVLFEKHYDLGFDAFLAEQYTIRDNLSNLYKGPSFMKSNKTDEIFHSDILDYLNAKLNCPKDEFGKLMKPDNFKELYAPEPKLQLILDQR